MGFTEALGIHRFATEPKRCPNHRFLPAKSAPLHFSTTPSEKTVKTDSRLKWEMTQLVHFTKVRPLLAALLSYSLCLCILQSCQSKNKNDAFKGSGGAQADAGKITPPNAGAGQAETAAATLPKTPVGRLADGKACLIPDPADSLPPGQFSASKLGWDGVSPLATPKFSVVATE